MLDSQTSTADAPADESVKSALSSTPPATFAEGLKDLLDISDTVGTAFSGPLAILEAYDILEKLVGAGFEARVMQDLAMIRAQIQDVAAKIADGQQLTSAQDASWIIALAQTGAENARMFIKNTGGSVFDPNTNPSASNANTFSRAAALAFMNDAWYSKVSAYQGQPREFEWRMGLPHLIAAIAYRLEVIAAMRPDFSTSGAFADEIREYYNSIGSRLAQADAALIWCYNATISGPIYDLNQPIRFCRNSQTGVAKAVGTIANPVRDAIVRAQLMDEMGFNQIRAFRDRLHDLANNLPSNLSFCASEWQTCSLPAVKTARYGASGAFYFRTASSGSLSCTNDVFGDPLPGTPKSCSAGNLVSYPCSNEFENCYFDGVKYVTYGSGSSITSKMALSGIECSNGEFGDPIPGVYKSCTYYEPVWIRCADEGGTCAISGPSFVRYGYGNKFRYWKQSFSFSCDNAGGDPVVGQPKVCEVARSQ